MFASILRREVLFEDYHDPFQEHTWIDPVCIPNNKLEYPQPVMPGLLLVKSPHSGLNQKVVLKH